MEGNFNRRSAQRQRRLAKQFQTVDANASGATPTGTRVTMPEQRAQILVLDQDFSRLWQAPTTAVKDRKRMLRLLIKDITVKKPAPKQVLLHIRWQGGACSDVTVEPPPARRTRSAIRRSVSSRSGLGCPSSQ